MGFVRITNRGDCAENEGRVMDWTQEEIQAASKAMKSMGQLSYDEFLEKIDIWDAKVNPEGRDDAHSMVKNEPNINIHIEDDGTWTATSPDYPGWSECGVEEFDCANVAAESLEAWITTRRQGK